MRVVTEANGLEIVLEDPPLGSGGEATVHAVAGQPDVVGKQYRKPTAEHAAKVAAMIAAPPADLNARKHASIAWPTTRLLSTDADRRFLGYLMPRVHDTRLLYEVYNPRSRQQVAPGFHYGHLLRVARNLCAAAVKALHDRGYVIGDVNESNILVSRAALVTLIDTDSFQVRSAEQVYRCRVGKPEYTPPEVQRSRFADIDRSQEHDAFGLAVLVFQLLMQGTHPFTGVFTGVGEPGAIPRWIEEGFFPYARSKTLPVKPRPHAPPWKVLPPVLQELMLLCFETGHTQPKARPSAGDWLSALALAEEELQQCEANPQHHYPAAVTDGCPWCETALLLGRDPFPTVEEQRARSSREAAPVMAQPAPVDVGDTTAVMPLAELLAPPPGPQRQATVKIAARATNAIKSTPVRPATENGVSSVGAVKAGALVKFPVSTPVAPPPAPLPAALSARKKPPPAKSRGALWAVLLLGGVSLLIFGVVAFVAYRATKKKPVDVAVATNVSTPVPPPIEERPAHFPWEPKELVAVLGEYRGRSWSYAQCVLYGRDGKLYSGGSNGDIYQWDADTLELRQVLPGPRLATMALALSPDGSQLAAIGPVTSRSVLILDPRTGAEKYAFKGPESGGNSLAYGNDGKILAIAGGVSRSVNLWDAERGTFKEALPGPFGVVISVAFSSDGKTLAAGSQTAGRFPAEVKIWDAATREEKKTLRGGTAAGAAFRALAFSPDGQTLATVTDHLQLWDVARGTEIACKGDTSASGRALAFSPDGTTVAWENNREIVLFNVAKRERKASFAVPDLPAFGVISLAYSPDSRTLAVGTGPTLRLLDAATGKERVPLKGHTDRLLALAVSQDGQTVITGGGDGMVRAWDVAERKEIASHGKMRAEVVALAGNADVREVLLAARDGEVWRWAPRSNDAGRLLPPGGGRPLAISSSGRVVLAPEKPGDRGVKLWVRADDKETAMPPLRRDVAECAAFGLDGKTVVIGSQTPTPAATDWETRVTLWTGGETGTVYYPNALGGGVSALALSPDGKWLAAGGYNGALRYLNRTTRAEVANLEGHTRTVGSITFAPDGKRFVSADDNGRVILWEAGTFNKVRDWKLPGRVLCTAFSGDGRILVLGNGNGTAYVLRVPGGEQASEMRVLLETTGAEFPLEERPLGSGGEATVYALEKQPFLAAKLYRKASPEHAAKLLAMLAAPPTDLTAKKHVSIAWPTSRLLAPGPDRLFLGYLMPRVHDTRLLYEIYNPRSRQQAAPGFTYAHLLRVARNLSAAVKALHDRGYVIGDVNESNILVSREALVTLIDTDSFQVRSPTQVFRCRVGKPEYTPPELQRARFAEIERGPEHDVFGLAVLIFQLLMHGTHPFTGVYTGPGEPGSVPRWIEDGLFPYGQKKLPVRPRPHSPPWKVVPMPVQRLFLRCFEDGHSDPGKRPSATEWLTTLTEVESGLRACPMNAQHRYPDTLLQACPWCEMASQQGKDPFSASSDTASTAVKAPVMTMKVLPAAPLPAPVRTVKTARVASGLPTQPDEAWKWWLAGGATLFLILLGLGAVVGLLLARGRPPEERRPAEWKVESTETGGTRTGGSQFP